MIEARVVPGPEADTRIYVVGGRCLPSVTTVLKMAGLGVDFSGIPPATLLAAAARGTAIHALAESRLRPGNVCTIDAEMPPGFEPYLEALDLAIKELRLEALLVEQPVYSDRLGIAGRLDALAWWAGARPLVLLDFKSGQEHPAAHGLQVGGYQLLLADSVAAGRLDGALIPALGATREEVGKAIWGGQRATIYVKRSGVYKVVLHDDVNDLLTIEAAACVLRARWRRFLGDDPTLGGKRDERARA